MPSTTISVWRTADGTGPRAGLRHNTSDVNHEPSALVTFLRDVKRWFCLKTP